METVTPLWLILSTVVSAKSHRRVMCPLWRALAKRDIETKKGPFAQFYCPSEVTVDGCGNDIVTDKGNHCIRKITPQGHVSTLAGTSKEGYQDGGGTVAHFNFPDIVLRSII